jgi:acyl dehydratase
MKRQFTEEDVVAFSHISQDYNPVHLNDAYAKTVFHQKRIVQGMLVATMFSSIFGNRYPGKGSIYVSQSLKFSHPGKNEWGC